MFKSTWYRKHLMIVYYLVMCIANVLRISYCRGKACMWNQCMINYSFNPFINDKTEVMYYCKWKNSLKLIVSICFICVQIRCTEHEVVKKSWVCKRHFTVYKCLLWEGHSGLRATFSHAERFMYKCSSCTSI